MQQRRKENDTVRMYCCCVTSKAKVSLQVLPPTYFIVEETTPRNCKSEKCGFSKKVTVKTMFCLPGTVLRHL